MEHKKKLMKEQLPKERIKNFNEVPFGLTEAQAVAEASRCLNCRNPFCVKGCPAEIDIPAFVQAIKNKKFKDAIEIIRKTNNLPAVCGRVCPQEDQCEKFCILGKKGAPIAIGYLERFVADWEMAQANSLKPSTANPKPITAAHHKVAVIGAGPAGLTCAADLANMGYDVTIFEALHSPGGVLMYGIPEFRLPKKIVEKEVGNITGLGAGLKLNYIIGRTKTIGDLKKEGFKAFFIATGAGLPNFLGIPGEELNGVYSANEFLTRINLMKAYKFPEYDTPVNIGEKIAVIGAGNVAMDSARCALRMGAKKVYIIYRRSREEMPARAEEIERAEEEGVIFNLLTNPVRITGDEKGNIKEMTCLKNKLGEPDEGGRRRPIPIPDSEFSIPIDTVICAVGNDPNPLLVSTVKEIITGKRGNIVADEEGRTSVEGIFAGGDIVTGAATVIAAMGAGKKAARAVDKYLKGL
ncbi:MAG: NADPH-dependent glutamate synthase [Candidatus Omnitrophica bacterium]|nr:NADPH-dependent glutamate synthase [Candidatus Omnitrophota bacterium]